MFVPILIAAGAAVAGVLGFAATRPAQFRIQRSARIEASPEKIFAVLDDFHQWPSWSPWEELDPAMNRTHSGSPSGRGAIYEWKGNKKVGRGRMEILESDPSKKVVIKLDFFEPWKAHNTTEFTLTPAAGGTDVLWSMTGENAFMMKLMGLFMNMDKLVGKDFEKGLAKLNRVVT
jgi:uncharacterized protein YndB with AHSA1/START domain